MTTGARSRHLIPAIITMFCAAVLIAAVSWFMHTGHAGQTAAHEGAGTTTHVVADLSLTSGVGAPPWDAPPWDAPSP